MAKQPVCKGGGDDGCFTILALCFVLWFSGILGVDEQVEKMQQDINGMKRTIERIDNRSKTQQKLEQENGDEQ